METKKTIFGFSAIKGQITIFIILTFQVLFVFLVMMINIGFVIHDKINLQNSVDLGVIYGAQKQAEILDAMAHINYQIRQSYKLLAWRYLVLGQLGANYSRNTSGIANYQIPLNLTNDTKLNCNQLTDGYTSSPNCRNPDDINQITQSPIATCMWHPEWYFPTTSSGRSDHVCQKTNPRGAGGGSVPLPRWDTSTPPFVIGRNTIRQVTETARSTIERSCKGMGLLNWLMASSFLYQFRYDQWQRRILIEDLFKLLAVSKKDLDEDSIETGVKNTIEKNLTQNNRNAWSNAVINIQFTTDGKNFKDFFTWNEITPILFYIESPDGDSTNSVCPSYPVPTFVRPSASSNGHLELFASNLIYTDVETPSPFGHNTSPPSGMNADWMFIPLVSGFYRNNISTHRLPFSVKVSVSLKYKNKMFSPFVSSIPLKAIAYAKPFGAKFGPLPGADSLLPMPSTGPSFSPPPSTSAPYTTYNPLLHYRPNYSKYPGDLHGLLSQAVQSQWVHKLITGNPQADGRSNTNYEVSTHGPDPMVQKFEQTNGTNYRLDINGTKNMIIRKQEELAIAPDLFDVTYYTILSNYMAAIFTKIRKNSLIGQQVKNATGYLPGDLGDLKNFDTPGALGDSFRNCFRYFEKKRQ